MKKKISFRAVLMILTAFLVGWVVWKNWPDIVVAWESLADANFWVLLLFLPEQLFFYYACGQIFFSFVNERKAKKDRVGPAKILRISTELNFVTHAIPAGGVGGLAFMTYRLKPFGVSAGQTSFLYIFRYAITTVFNYLQALIAIIILLACSLVPSEAMWVIPLTLIMNLGMGLILWLVIFIAKSKRRIVKFEGIVRGLGSFLIRIVTFGRKKEIVGVEKLDDYFLDIHESVKIAKENKKYLKKPVLWGVAFSLLEIAAYWLVALAFGRPEILLYIMVGEAIGSVLDGIVPYGLYELGMAGVMIALGVDFATATIVTVVTRAVMLLFTIISGVVPYYKAIGGRKNKQEA